MKLCFGNAIRNLLGIFFCLSFHFSFTQTIEREVIASSGDYSFNNSVKVEWTVGEIAAAFYTDSKSMVNVGFHQTDIEYVGISTVNQPSLFRIYPNPTTDYLYIELLNSNADVSIRIINLLGNDVYKSTFNSTERILIQMTNFSSGFYNVELTNNDLNQREVHRIIKK